MDIRKEYTVGDLKSLHELNVVLYEFDDEGNPVKHGSIVNDGISSLIWVGFKNGEYGICYHVIIGDKKYEECISGEKYLLKCLNNGSLRPADEYLGDNEDVFSQLGESIKKIIREELKRNNY